MIRPRQERSVLVHYFSVDLEAERRTFAGVPYTEEPFSEAEQARIVHLAAEFDARFRRWLTLKQQNAPHLYCRYPPEALFSPGFFERGFHAYFGFTNFAEVHTNLARSLLHDFVREFVRELSRQFVQRWWKFDYRLLFKSGRAFRRDTTNWETTPADCPLSEEARLFLAS